MRVTGLEVRGVRCLSDVSMALGPEGAWIEGPNGAGKTSVLEAICLLGFGRSFRGKVADGLIQRGKSALEVIAHWEDGQGRRHVSGLRHAGDAWEGRLDGQAVASLGALAAPFPVLCFHPNSSDLVTGPAEERRRALDWLAFHVEPRFGELSRRYGRALKQRNALLRSGATNAEFEPWEREMSDMAEGLSVHRESVVGLLSPALSAVWPHLSDAPSPALALRPGWRQKESSLGDLLLLNRERDRELGYTTVGPQRADLDLGAAFDAPADQLSRGQAKLVALAVLLAQAEALRAWTGERSALLFDDLGAELDRDRQVAVLAWVNASGHQCLVTGTEVSDRLRLMTPSWDRFHVEHGVLQPLDPPPTPGA